MLQRPPAFAVVTVAVATFLCSVYVFPFSDGLASSSTSRRKQHQRSPYFEQSRAQLLNLLNHPLQLQLATGDLPLGSFQRLLSDRLVLLEALQIATADVFRDTEAIVKDDNDRDIHAQYQTHQKDAESWLKAARAQGKTIRQAGMACYTCGGEHINIDCPNDQEPSQSVRALASVLKSSGLLGAMAVLEGYSFACTRLLDAVRDKDMDDVTKPMAAPAVNNTVCYQGWLEAHAEEWSRFAERCHEKHMAFLLSSNQGADRGATVDKASSAQYTTCLSMLYNWIDMEASTTGIRADILSDDSALASLVETLEVMEPGYAASRDKHSSFVADKVLVASKKNSEQRQAAKVKAAAAYLAAKKKNKK